ncbi:MAG: alpha/beta hydrolase, partial [Lactobacillaceae bacterium]
MIKHWRKWLLLLVSVLAVTAIMLPATSWMEQNVKSARVVHNSRMQPIILIPGSSATEDRFNTLITQLNAQTTGHSLLKITVKTNGTLTY